MSDEATELLVKLVSEVDFVISGGDQPCERCTECGLAGIGMLRDARRDAVAFLECVGRIAKRTKANG